MEKSKDQTCCWTVGEADSEASHYCVTPNDIIFFSFTKAHLQTENYFLLLRKRLKICTQPISPSIHDPLHNTSMSQSASLPLWWGRIHIPHLPGWGAEYFPNTSQRSAAYHNMALFVLLLKFNFVRKKEWKNHPLKLQILNSRVSRIPPYPPAFLLGINM